MFSRGVEYMVLKLIDDMNKALDNNCFLSALAIALTLPDICGNAKYPDLGVTKRYTKWYDEYIGKYEKCPGREDEMPYLSGEIVYQLRCSFLHSGNPNVSKDKITEDCCKVDNFILVTEKKKTFNSYTDACYSTDYNFLYGKSEERHLTYEVNVRRLCLIISETAKEYYISNKELFDFFDFTIVDRDDWYRTYDDGVNQFEY